MDCYDPESGLVFRETIVKARHRSERVRDWESACVGLKQRLAPPPEGVESLYTKAMRKIIQNAWTMFPEILQAVPPILVTQIWKAIRRKNRESLHIWKIFVESGCGDRSFAHSTHLYQNSFREPLVNYFSRISSTSMAWMTDVHLFDISCTAAELKQLKTVVNIRKLHIGYSQSSPYIEFDDKVVEYWALCAKDRTAFRFLGIVAALNTPAITSNSFQVLNHFPALGSIVLYNTAIRNRHPKLATQYGWSTQLDGGFSSLLKARQMKRSYANLKSAGASADVQALLNSRDIQYGPEHAELDGVPALSVKFSKSSRERDWHLSDLHDVLCFERKFNSKGFATKGEPTPQIAVIEEGPANKKPKIRDSRSVQLDNLFDLF